MGIAGQLEALSADASGVVIAGTSLGRSVAPALAAIKEMHALSTNTISLPLGKQHHFKLNAALFRLKALRPSNSLADFLLFHFIPTAFK